VLRNFNGPVGGQAHPSCEKLQSEVHLAKPAPSNVLSKLAALSKNPDTQTSAGFVRSAGFNENPVPPLPPGDPSPGKVETDTQGDETSYVAARRDDRLALIEDLEPGPYEHKAPFDDPHFQQLEPNSGIRMT
jgi:minichromosome maintenance protein 10